MRFPGTAQEGAPRSHLPAEGEDVSSPYLPLAFWNIVSLQTNSSGVHGPLHVCFPAYCGALRPHGVWEVLSFGVCLLRLFRVGPSQLRAVARCELEMEGPAHFKQAFKLCP